MSIIQIKLGFTSVFLIKGNSCVLVDAGMPGDGDKILSALDKHGIEANDISMILITHGHADHYGSAEYLKKRTGAKIAIHKLDADVISQGRNADINAYGFRGFVFKKLVPDSKRYEGVKADIIFDEAVDLNQYGIKGVFKWMPGHTKGSSAVILDEEGEAIIGDMLMTGFFRKKTPTIPHFISDEGEILKSVDELINQKVKKFYISHGNPLDVQAIIKWRKKYKLK